MTTSSYPRNDDLPSPQGNHWHELTATLPKKRTEELGEWLDAELVGLETALEAFVTNHSLRRSLRR